MEHQTIIRFTPIEKDLLKDVNALNTLKMFKLDITPAYEELLDYKERVLTSTLDKLQALRNRDKAILDDSQNGLFELSHYGLVDYVFMIQELVERLEEGEE